MNPANDTLLRIVINKSLDLVRVLRQDPLIAAMVLTLCSALSRCLNGQQFNQMSYIHRVKQYIRGKGLASQGLVAVCLWQLEQKDINLHTTSIVEVVRRHFLRHDHMIESQNVAIIWSDDGDMFFFMDEARGERTFRHFGKSVERLECVDWPAGWHGSLWNIYVPNVKGPFKIVYRQGLDPDFDRFVAQALPQMGEQFSEMVRQGHEALWAAFRKDALKALLDEWDQEELERARSQDTTHQ